MGGQVTCIYLEDLQATENLPLGLELIQLVVEPKRRAKAFARQLVERLRQKSDGAMTYGRAQTIATDKLLDLIETILVYKFGSLTTKELEAMFGLSELKKTRVFQEGREEGQGDERRGVIEAAFITRFSKIDRLLSATIPALMELPQQEMINVLFNSSREEIIDRFSPKI
jgi:predicted transposase YdaD